MKYLISILSIVVGIVIVLTVYLALTNRSNEMSTLTIGPTKIQVEIVNDPVSRQQGLSGRESLCQNCGMLFVFGESKIQNFWMQDMNFPLDFVFIDNGKVVGVQEDVEPLDQAGEVNRVRSRIDAAWVLELNAGFVRSEQIKIGDDVSLDPAA